MNEERWQVITRKIRAVNPELNLAQKLCLVGVEVLHAETVSLALVVDHAYSAIAASDHLATLLDEQQFALGDGPTFDAQDSSTPIVVADTGNPKAGRKWPAFTPIAERHGIQGVFAFPLRIGMAYLGVMSAYRSRPDAPSANEYADGLILASMATADLVRHQAGVTPPDLADIFAPGLAAQSQLQIATGMVSELLNCSAVSALVRIRARAFADDKPVSEIARAIVARELILKNS